MGAGMAGLAAAESLYSSGFKVEIVEQAAVVGGRVKSVAFHGRTIECGAQFPSTGYRHIPQLFERMGLAGSIEKASPWAAYERKGQLHKINPRRPITFMTSGLLRWNELFDLARGSISNGGAPRDRSCYAAYAPDDVEEALPWCTRKMGRGASEHLLDATIHGFYFYSLASTSRALVSALMSFRGSEALAIRGGWDSLPRAMAKTLNVRTGLCVHRLIEQAGRVKAFVDKDTIEYDWVILAVPAPAANRILVAPNALESCVLQTRYASTVHVALGMHPDWSLPKSLNGIHGILLSANEHAWGEGLVASMVVESARLSVVNAPETLTLMLTDSAARRFAENTDDYVIEEVVKWLEARWAGIGSSVVSHRVQRWNLAEPLTPVGRARNVQQYRIYLPTQRKVLLCGDYMGMPWTDGAVETGLWAADRIRMLARKGP